MLWPTEPATRWRAVRDMSMNAKRVGCAVLAATFAAMFAAMFAAILGATACDRTTSVGAAGGQPDADVGDGASSGDGDASPSAEELCTSTGGTVGTSFCCANVISFPDSCAIGACGCGPANATTAIPVCNCPSGCFTSGVGCVGAQGACTEGNDLTCNQDTTLTNPRGRCVAGNRCACAAGATLSSSGKCL